MLCALWLLASPPAAAGGFHFLKVEALGGVDEAGSWEGGIGAGTFSDALHLWATFGDAAEDGRVLRELWFDSRSQGPVLGVVPRPFADIVDPYQRSWLFRWSSFHAGSDAHARKTVELDLAQQAVLNVFGWGDTDPRRLFVGPTAGLGANATWWEEWKDEPAPVMTGKITARGGVVAGGTLRDTVYGQGRLVARADLFGAHQYAWVVGGVAGVYLQRLGLPVGVELTAEREAGNDNVHAAAGATWEARASLYWKLAPAYQTRLEEQVERELGPAR